MLNPYTHEQSTFLDIKPLLAKILRRLQSRFGEQLVSVVVYGSYARGNATNFSDIDVLVVLSEVPRNWNVIFALEHEVGSMGRGLGKKVQGQVLSREDVVYSMQSLTPMMLEVFDAHRVLIDHNEFFARQMQNFVALINQQGIRKLRQSLWRIPIDETRK